MFFHFLGIWRGSYPWQSWRRCTSSTRNPAEVSWPTCHCSPGLVFFFFFFYIIITTQNKSLAIDVKCKYTYYNLRESSLVETPFTYTLICIQTFSAFLRYCLTLLKIYRQITTLCSTTEFFHNLSVHLKVFLYSDNKYWHSSFLNKHLFLGITFNFEIIIETIISAECLMFILSARLRAKKHKQA